MSDFKNEREDRKPKQRRKTVAQKIGLALMIAGAAAFAALGLAMIMDSGTPLDVLENTDQNIIPFKEENKPQRIVYCVDPYLRGLPKGQKHSEAKVAEALNAGIILPKDKTYVHGYSAEKIA